MVTPNAGSTTTSSGPSGCALRIGVAQELDALGAQPVVDVRVVDDLAGQEDAAIRKPLARLIRIVDGAIDAIAESEFAREMNRQPARLVLKVVGLDALDQIAVIVLVELGRDRMLSDRGLCENERG